MDISVHRNFFGRQISSFESDIPLKLPNSTQDNIPSPSSITFPGVFIRAPAILSVKDEVGVRVLGEIHSPANGRKVIVAAQQGPLLATVFHPELTRDTRIHEYFVDVVREYQRKRCS